MGAGDYRPAPRLFETGSPVDTSEWEVARLEQKFGHRPSRGPVRFSTQSDEVGSLLIPGDSEATQIKFGMWSSMPIRLLAGARLAKDIRP